MTAPVAFRVGDRVVRNKAVGSSEGERGDMGGTVVKVTVAPHGTGGTHSRIRVLWDNGYTASVEDRQLLLEPCKDSGNEPGQAVDSNP
jgi:hypothetical protein